MCAVLGMLTFDVFVRSRPLAFHEDFTPAIVDIQPKKLPPHRLPRGILFSTLGSFQSSPHDPRCGEGFLLAQHHGDYHAVRCSLSPRLFLSSLGTHVVPMDTRGFSVDVPVLRVPPFPLSKNGLSHSSLHPGDLSWHFELQTWPDPALWLPSLLDHGHHFLPRAPSLLRNWHSASGCFC